MRNRVAYHSPQHKPDEIAFWMVNERTFHFVKVGELGDSQVWKVICTRWRANAHTNYQNRRQGKGIICWNSRQVQKYSKMCGRLNQVNNERVWKDYTVNLPNSRTIGLRTLRKIWKVCEHRSNYLIWWSAIAPIKSDINQRGDSPLTWIQKPKKVFQHQKSMN